MIVISFISTKGGVGKTTLAAYTSGILADMGLRTLMVDADLRPMLTKFYPLESEAENGFFWVITKGLVGASAISKTKIPNLDLVYSDVKDSDASGWLHGRLDRDVRLRQALRCPFVQDNYDVVVVDSQGAAGVLQEACALAADELVSPIIPEVLSVREFRDGTIEELYARITQARVSPGPLRAVINRMARTKDANDMVLSLRSELRTAGNPKITALNTIIPSAKAYTEAATQRMPVHRHERTREGTMPSANQVMHQFIWELIPNLQGIYAAGSEEGFGGEQTREAAE